MIFDAKVATVTLILLAFMFYVFGLPGVVITALTLLLLRGVH